MCSGEEVRNHGSEGDSQGAWKLFVLCAEIAHYILSTMYHAVKGFRECAVGYRIFGPRA